MSAEKAPVAVLQVALKRIPDVLSSPEQAKRVLREVCILRRLKHPFLINLRDAFTQPSTCGKPLCSSQPALPSGTSSMPPHAASPCVSHRRPCMLGHTSCFTGVGDASILSGKSIHRERSWCMRVQGPSTWSMASCSRPLWMSISPWNLALMGICSISGALLTLAHTSEQGL